MMIEWWYIMMRDVYSVPMVCPPKIFGHAAQILGGFRSWLSKSLGKLIIIKTKRYKLMRRLYWFGCLMLQWARPNLHISPSAPITNHEVNMSGVSPFTLVKTVVAVVFRLILNRVCRLQIRAELLWSSRLELTLGAAWRPWLVGATECSS